MVPFSLPQTAPAQGQTSGSLWNSEGEQYFHQDSHGSTQSGYSDSLNSFHVGQETQTAQVHGRGSFSGFSRGPWKTELSSTEMSRHPSMDSIGTHSQGTYSSTVNSFDQIRSARMYPDDSQMSFNVSPVRSDASDRSNSPVYTPTQQELGDFDNYAYQNGEDLSGAHPMFHRSSIATIATAAGIAGPAYNMFTPTGDDIFVSMPTGSLPLPGDCPVSRDSLSFIPSAIMNSPPELWDTDFLDSQRSSPTLLEDPWQLPLPQAMPSTTSSPPMDGSPTLDDLSPRVSRKPIGPRQSKVTSDLASRRPRAPGSSETSDESFKLVGRSSLEFDNTAREHPLYHNVTPKADGLYHCPFEDDPKANCTHKPEKLKCNYDKFVDSHLKPYKCKINTCKDLCFSSTACLLRHEREAHAMHGHGDKPFLCSYEGCERGVSGNGFPRHWNLRDHMKRVHNDPGSPPVSGSATKGKKRKAGDSPDAAMEKSLKRNASPPAVTRQPQEPSLVERYTRKHQILTETVAKLQDPKNADNMTLLRSANDCIKVMVQTTQRINAAPAMGHNFSQQSG